MAQELFKMEKSSEMYKWSASIGLTSEPIQDNKQNLRIILWLSDNNLSS